MASRKNNIVYSTDPSFKSGEDNFEEEETLPAAEQKLKITLDKKHRGGKTVTLVDGYRGKQADLEDLGKRLKTYCGTGGSVKDSQIIIQGDQLEKVRGWLRKNGFVELKN